MFVKKIVASKKRDKEDRRMEREKIQRNEKKEKNE
jgi:hypothetical protein